jgi:hypothetical protein
VVNFDKELAMDLAEDDGLRGYLEEALRTRGIDEERCREREFQRMLDGMRNLMSS